MSANRSEGGHSSFRLHLLMSQNLRSSVGKDERQFVREPLAVVQDFCAVLFLFFPVIGELYRAPMSDVAIFSVSEYSVQHPRRAEQSNVAAVKRREWPTSNVSLPGKKDSSRLSIGCGIEHQILDLIQRNAGIGEYSWSGRRDFVARFWSLSQDRKVGFQSQPHQPAHTLLERMVARILVPLSPSAKNRNLFVPDSL